MSIGEGKLNSVETVRLDKAIDYLKSLPRDWLPKSLENGIREPSNSQLIRWLRSKSIIINGKRPTHLDKIQLPIKELIFFPSSNRRTTIIKDDIK